MGLFGFGKKKAKLTIEMHGFDTSGKEVKLKDRQETESETEMAKIYVENYELIKNEIKPLENNFVTLSSSLSSIKKTDDRITALKSIISSFYDLKSKCISLGPDYQKYFSQMWEHCHNCANPDFSYIDKYQEELDYLQQNRDELVAKEALHDAAVEGLEDKVLSALKQCPSILQTDLYKSFDPIVQKDIQSILYFMAKDGIITRTKSGRTYQIDLRKENRK